MICPLLELPECLKDHCKYYKDGKCKHWKAVKKDGRIAN